ncbi:MAG: type IV pilin N-terminal domain-containing protein [Methanoregula sp.]|jgi:FlaG/FlaF family flagellin (archaellin)|uniref:type IV pilin N-terminal domain-containing protein n=1 Tax=Methanoregula sp. TaxID=2052170 RepID=UPI0025E89850|nr:type IV pilin N-terminal domain-containing protein [Methanoregula sp.]MCK9630599.1 type IV pilin N-terminal domain-containing protein [Methanoregula sp.]
MMQNHEQAVSPVIGVMLMLVVVIIIAALVSAFSGSTVSGTSKAPQATVQGTYSQTNGMTISHTGGDAIPMDTTTILVQPSRSFGADASRYSWVVNKSYVFTNATQTWATARAFLPGDTVTISKDNLSYVQQRPAPDDMPGDADDPSYGFKNPGNIGLTFSLVFQDTSGKTIGQSTVVITK